MRLEIASVLAALTMVLAPLSASADHLDVLQMKLNDKCEMDEFMEIVNDFNVYFKARGYQAEILIPVHTEDQEHIFWLGRSTNTQAFGAAHDHWLEEIAKKGTVPRKLSDRFTKCGTTVQRSSWVTAN